jgi:hypothetical protein
MLKTLHYNKFSKNIISTVAIQFLMLGKRPVIDYDWLYFTQASKSPAGEPGLLHKSAIDSLEICSS